MLKYNHYIQSKGVNHLELSQAKSAGCHAHLTYNMLLDPEAINQETISQGTPADPVKLYTESHTMSSTIRRKTN